MDELEMGIYTGDRKLSAELDARSNRTSLLSSA
jgi:hypothetical protein